MRYRFGFYRLAAALAVACVSSGCWLTRGDLDACAVNTDCPSGSVCWRNPHADLNVCVPAEFAACTDNGGTSEECRNLLDAGGTDVTEDRDAGDAGADVAADPDADLELDEPDTGDMADGEDDDEPDAGPDAGTDVREEPSDAGLDGNDADADAPNMDQDAGPDLAVDIDVDTDADADADAPPLAAADEYELTAGSTLTVPDPGVLANDTTFGGVLTAAEETAPEHGSLTLGASGGFTYIHDGSDTIADSFTYRALDSGLMSEPATVTLQINVAPSALGQSVVTGEDRLVSITLDATDANDDSLTFVLVDLPSDGTLSSFNELAGTVDYTPDGGFSGSDSFTFRVNDGELVSNEAEVMLTVQAEPNAAADQYVLTVGATLVVPAPGVLDNDTTFGGALSAVEESLPSHGSLTLGSDGGFTYVHDGSATTTDSFTYRASDGELTSQPATVTLLINHAPVASDQFVVTGEEQLVSITLEATDANDDTLTFELVDLPSNGTLSNFDELAGTVDYTPDGGFSGSDSFTFRVTDGELESNDAEVMLTIQAEPFAATDEYTLVAGATLVVPNPGVLENDTTFGGPLSAVEVTSTSHGELTLGGGGGFTYIHDGTDTVLDSFMYRAFDDELLSEPATVTLLINVAPVASGQSVVTGEDQLVGITLDATDANDDVLTFEVVDLPSNGTLTSFDELAGTVDYTPDAGFSGSDSLTFRVSDGELLSSTAEVMLTIEAKPDAAPDEYSLTAGSTLVVPNPGVLDNDTTFGGPLTAIEVTSTSNGSLTLAAGGGFTYIHDGTDTVVDTFTYRAVDGGLMSDPTTVTLQINVAPVAAGQSVGTGEDQLVSITLVATDANDDTLTFELVDLPTDGTLSNFDDLAGTVDYTPDPGFSGADSFTFRVSDGELLSNVADVMLTIQAAPSAAPDEYALTAGSTLVVPDPGVLDNDTTFGGPLTAAEVTTTSNGTLTLGSGGGFTYIHDGSATITDSFTYRAVDGGLMSDPATVTFQINVAPVAAGQSVVTGEDQLVGITLAATDANDDTLTFELVDLPTNGGLGNFDALAGTVDYTPDLGFSGSDSFTFRVDDGELLSNIAEVMLTVEAKPEAAPDEYNLTAGSTLVLSDPGVLENDTTFGGPLTALEVTTTNNGSLTFGSGGGFTYIHDGTDTTIDTFTYRAVDGGLQSDPATVTLQINVGPVASGQSVLTGEDQLVSITLDATDANDDTLTFEIVDLPTNGTLTNFDALAGTVDYTPDPGFSGSDSFTFRVDDGELPSNIAEVMLTIDGAPSFVAIPGDQSTLANRSLGPLTITIDDPDTVLGDLMLVATSDRQDIVPDGGIGLAGTGSTRSLTLLTEPDQAGVVTITLDLSDGVNLLSSGFVVYVGVTNNLDDVAEHGSLRRSLSIANSGDTITFDTDYFNADQSQEERTIELGSQLVVDSELTIEGPGRDLLTLSGRGLVRVLQVTGTGDLELLNLTIEGGSASTGAGLSNSGLLTMSGCTLVDNYASDGGGAIYSVGIAAIRDTTISGNSAEDSFGGQGGGLSNGGEIVIESSTFLNNSSKLRGGAIHSWGGLMTLTNTTLSGNSAGDGGGGIYNASAVPLELRHCTLVANHAGGPSRRGGALSASGTDQVILVGNIIAGNEADDDGTSVPDEIEDRSGNAIDPASSFNIIGDASTSATIQDGVNGNMVGVDWTTVLETVLADNGGSTLTHAVLSSGPAIDGSPTVGCVGSDGFALLTDQRGEPRPSGVACDVGAFERQPSDP